MHPLYWRSAIASIPVEKKIHLFYRSHEQIVEASSEDCKTWTTVSTITDEEAQEQSALTAFYCEKDTTNGEKPSIHIIYIDSRMRLREFVRALDAPSWKELPFPVETPAPFYTTKLISGACHDDKGEETRHWLCYSCPTDTRLIELRRSVQGEWKEHKGLLTVLDHVMPGSDITTSQEGSTTHLLYQTSGDRVISLGGDYYQWTHNKMNTMVVPTDTIFNTPLASCIDSKGKYYVFFVKEVEGENHVHAIVDGEQTSVALWTEGSFVGAVLLNDKPVLFMDQVANEEAHLCAFTNEGASWSLLGEVTKSS